MKGQQKPCGMTHRIARPKCDQIIDIGQRLNNILLRFGKKSIHWVGKQLYPLAEFFPVDVVASSWRCKGAYQIACGCLNFLLL